MTCGGLPMTTATDTISCRLLYCFVYFVAMAAHGLSRSCFVKFLFLFLYLPHFLVLRFCGSSRAFLSTTGSNSLYSMHIPCFTSFSLSSLHFFLFVSVSRGYTAHDFRSSLPLPRLQKRSINSSSPFIITGIPANGSGPAPQRLEIRQLQENPLQWNLYLLAMAEYQKMDQSDLTSYYQIAGIHGRPFVPWNQVAYTPGGAGGYCTHSSTLFPTW